MGESNVGRYGQDKGMPPELASEHFGALRKLPAVSFRGIDCNLLAEQYRKVRALESIEPDLPTLLSAGTSQAPWAEQTAAAARTLPRPELRKTR